MSQTVLSRFHVCFPLALAKKVRARAKREGISVSEFVRRAVMSYPTTLTK